QQSEARLRVVDAEGRVLADSARLGPKLEDDAAARVSPGRGRGDPLYRIGAGLYPPVEWLLRAASVPEPGAAGSAPTVVATPEIRSALAGRYGARARASSGGRRSMTLFSALPVWDGGRVVGAVEVSQSTARLFRALDQTRLGIFKVFLASVAVAVVLSL